MLEIIKKAMRISSAITAYDSEINRLVSAGLIDLGIAGVISDDTTDPIIQNALVTYVMMNNTFAPCKDYERWKKSYDEQKAQLQTASGYTDWGVC